MKFRALLTFAALTSFAIAGQDTPLRLTRHMAAGDVVVYRVHLTGGSPLGNIEFVATTKQTTTTLLPDGGATVTVQFLDFKVTARGAPVPADMPAPQTFDEDKFGVPKVAGSGLASQLDSLRTSAPYYDHDWHPGDTITLRSGDTKGQDNVAPNGSQSTAAVTTKGVDGTVKFIGVKGGDAIFDSDLSIASDANGEPAISLKSTTSYDVTTSVLDDIEGTIPDLPINPGIDLLDVKFSLKRLKS